MYTPRTPYFSYHPCLKFFSRSIQKEGRAEKGRGMRKREEREEERDGGEKG